MIVFWSYRKNVSDFMLKQGNPHDLIFKRVFVGESHHAATWSKQKGEYGFTGSLLHDEGAPFRAAKAHHQQLLLESVL